MTIQQSVCEMFSKWLKHSFVKNNNICFKISIDFETWLFLLFLNWEPVLWGTMGLMTSQRAWTNGSRGTQREFSVSIEDSKEIVPFQQEFLTEECDGENDSTGLPELDKKSNSDSWCSD